MSEQLNKFEISRNIQDHLKLLIRRYFIFDDYEGKNIIFIDEDDIVYGLGSNKYGQLGLGHHNKQREVDIVRELCGQNIVDFVKGDIFLIGISATKRVYAWGRNNRSQLGRGSSSEDFASLPELIESLNDKNISMVSVGFNHSLALSYNGDIYGWGDNRRGQLGFPPDSRPQIEKPTILNKVLNLDSPVKFISCAWNGCYALTNKGSVYCWGQNEHSNIEDLHLAKKVDIRDLLKICNTGRNCYFLDDEQQLYFCGKYNDFVVTSPKLIAGDYKFKDVYYANNDAIDSAVAEGLNGSIFELKGCNKPEITEFESYFDYYCERKQISFGTVIINNAISLRSIEIDQIAINQADINKNTANTVDNNDDIEGATCAPVSSTSDAQLAIAGSLLADESDNIPDEYAVNPIENIDTTEGKDNDSLFLRLPNMPIINKIENEIKRIDRRLETKKFEKEFKRIIKKI